MLEVIKELKSQMVAALKKRDITIWSQVGDPDYETLLNWIESRQIPLPDPIPYWFKIKERDLAWEQIKENLPLEFQTRSEARIFAQNLANLNRSEVRFQTENSSGTFIRPE